MTRPATGGRAWCYAPLPSPPWRRWTVFGAASSIRWSWRRNRGDFTWTPRGRERASHQQGVTNDAELAERLRGAARERNGSGYLFHGRDGGMLGDASNPRRSGARRSTPRRTGSVPASRTGRATTGWCTSFPSCASRTSMAPRPCGHTGAATFSNDVASSCSSGPTTSPEGLRSSVPLREELKPATLERFTQLSCQCQHLGL